MVDDLHVRVVTGPDLVADPRLLADLTAAEAGRLGVPAHFLAAADTEALMAELAAAGRDPGCALVILPGPSPAARALMTRAGPHATRTVWLDLTRTGSVPVAEGAAHHQGRGVWGLAWAVRHAVHRLRRPARQVAYGDGPERWAQLRLPAEQAVGLLPVAVLLHGGFWRSIWGADLMDALAIDLAARGYAAWNLEYRRPDRHGWAATTADVAAGIAMLTRVTDAALDLDRVAVLGHSAGGQLALRAGADGARVALTVSLAGVLDLAEGQRRDLSSGAVASALGGSLDEAPEVYAASDPLARLPLRVPQLIVQGTDDDLDLIDFNRRYAQAARAARDDITYLEQPGDHFAVIDPATAIWQRTAEAIAARLDHRQILRASEQRSGQNSRGVTTDTTVVTRSVSL